MPRPPRQFDAVLIDFYGTISAGDREAVDAVCQRIVTTCGLPLTASRFAILWGERFFRTVEAANHAAFRTLYECELSSLKETLADFGRHDPPEPFVAELEDYWLNPPLYADALAFLRELDRPVCCVSNADTASLHAAIERHGLRFDAVITSQDARCYKPDPAIFRRALAALGVQAHRAVHIGDSLHSDVGGAGALGISTVWLCRASRIHDIGTAAPDHTIADLAAVRPVLDGGNRER